MHFEGFVPKEFGGIRNELCITQAGDRTDAERLKRAEEYRQKKLAELVGRWGLGGFL